MEKPQFVENHIYHVYNRGVEKRNVFLDRKDHLRFIHDLYEMNDEQPTSNVLYYSKYMEVQPPYIERKRKRKLLVEILAFALMPNHFHILLRQKRENGVVRFMQKLGTAYTMYFNQKYKRVGGLFQGRYKAVWVHEEPHFIYLPFYIHANPLKIYTGLTSIDGMMRFLTNYRWSSFPDYVGKKNFPSVTSRDFLLRSFGGRAHYLKEVRDLLRHRKENIELIQEVALDNDF